MQSVTIYCDSFEINNPSICRQAWSSPTVIFLDPARLKSQRQTALGANQASQRQGDERGAQEHKTFSSERSGMALSIKSL